MIQIDNKWPEGEIIAIFFNNRLSKALSAEMKTKMDGIIFIRLARAGVIGQTLFDEGMKNGDKLDLLGRDQIAALCELYIFYIRSIYDYLLHFLRKKLGKKLPDSFNKFAEKVKKGCYPDLSKQFTEIIKEEKISFCELRNLRNSIKNQSSTICIDVKNKELFISAQILSQTKSPHSTIDEKLTEFVYRHSFNLWYLMMIIYMEIQGKTWDTLKTLK